MAPILCVGTVGLDTVETPFGRVDEALGGSAAYFAAAASLHAPVQLVSVVGEDFPQEHRTLLAQKADIEGLETLPGRCFRWSGRYHFDMNQRDTLDTQLNVLAEFNPKLPESYRDAEYVFLANVDPVLQLRVLEQSRGAKLTMLDSMNFWISSAREALTDVIRRVDIVMMNEEEVRQYADTSNLLKGARQIIALGPKTLIIKKGEYGAVLFQRNEQEGRDQFFYCPAYPLEDVKDPTGAGDSFAGGFLGYLAGAGDMSMAHLRRALVFGSAVASFTVEDFSVRRLATLTGDELRQRYRDFRELTYFDEV
ncbi:MAG: Ribokinase [uncultured Chloroflexi bacterium]|uniref:Ribokinase n=1 Tax=uncultured Chloroflexota bacterium TaxID=166587 RepID=A0A6J4KBA6_9CHLR|nr:MAG: Ribokinase [uncultured Chloroflexota bacterium]